MRKEIVPFDQIAHRIRQLRGEKVLHDYDLAALYGVAVKVLNQAVKRNQERFPSDFMFQLTNEEAAFLGSFSTSIRNRQVAQRQETATNWSQFVTSSSKHRAAKYRRYACTEEGVAMLSSVLNSDRAVKVNIAIMRAFVRLRQALDTNRELAKKFSELERRVGKHDGEIAAILEAIRQLMAPPEKPRREIGFDLRETPPRYRVTKPA
ncbi:MAG TPA: ORF6N domain-containing protein [Candidatus Udaeobacter sp.]|nr:ORF6N domain-containing protein [Candidatus Udaeobacter sp.]